MMKKLIILLAVFAVMLTVLSGCNKDGSVAEGDSEGGSSGYYIDDSHVPLEMGDRVE